MEGELKISSLGEEVYKYLRKQMILGYLLPGSTINIGEIAQQLGISKTPLRDALIHLEMEGFVTILPRKGVLVNVLQLQDVKNAYDAIGLVEAAIVVACIDKIEPSHIQKLEEFNEIMISDIEKEDFSTLFETNLRFHNVYIGVSQNELLKKFIHPIKQRLYDFPRQNYISEWERRNCEEHAQFISCLKKRDSLKAASILKEIHWSFDYQMEFIKEFYNMGEVGRQ